MKRKKRSEMSEMKVKRFGVGPRKRIYLINPRNPDNFWAMQSSVDAVGAKTLMPNSALATLIALTPPDVGVEYVFCDENVDEIDWSLPCDLVALTGFTLHEERIETLSRRFRDRGIPVALGGVFATLRSEKAEPLADHLFVGEAEHTWPRFLRQWVRGQAAPRYEQKGFVDLADTPPPDWSLVNGRDYVYFTVQTSRGCPNRCDFCEAILVAGRKYRTKSIDQIMREIRNAHAAGADVVFFSEDNFYVKKSFTKRLLKRIIEWNTSLAHPISFSCQATLKIGEDDEILRLLADAKFSVIFLGVESIRKECLDEINKGHMARFDPGRTIVRLSQHGILPFVGLIVGFDNDDRESFEELEAFLDETGCPIASVSVLNAPERTVLYDRMKERDRIDEDFRGVWHFSTNIVPTNMPIEELLSRHRSLFRRLYEPQHFERRMEKWIDSVEYFTSCYEHGSFDYRKLSKMAHLLRYMVRKQPLSMLLSLARLLYSTWRREPRLIKKVFTVMTQYCHYRDFANEAGFVAGEARQ